jgi:ABC-2 type transport system ATP-binding protein
MTVRVRGLYKSYRRFTRRTPVLKGIDLEIAPGEVVGLIGPNGAGKTTLMSCLLGFLRPDRGEITIDGRPADDLAIRARTGFVPDRMHFDGVVTARAFLRYMGRLAGIPAESVDARVCELMTRLDVLHGAEKRLSQHSRGMLQRVAMCQALLTPPDFLFLDEPASGLDPTGVLLVRDVILEQRARGAAVLLNSHQLAEVEKICDRVLFLRDGVIAHKERLRDHPRIAVSITMLDGTTIETEVGTEPEIAELVRSLVGEGKSIVNVQRRKVDLERMFRSAS